MDLIQPGDLCGDEVTLQGINQSFSEVRTPDHFLRVDPGQNVERMAALVINTLSTAAAGRTQPAQDIFLEDTFNIISYRRQPGSGPKVRFKRRSVRQNQDSIHCTIRCACSSSHLWGRSHRSGDDPKCCHTDRLGRTGPSLSTSKRGISSGSASLIAMQKRAKALPLLPQETMLGI